MTDDGCATSIAVSVDDKIYIEVRTLNVIRVNYPIISSSLLQYMLELQRRIYLGV